MPEGITSFLTPAELQHLGRLVLQSRYVVEGNLVGAHRSPQRGSSSEFADHRAYFEGDDIKRIDWKVLARTERYYVRRYEDETNLRVYLVLDRSASMGYGSEQAKTTKYEFAAHLAAALGYVVVKARDSVGLFLHSDRIDTRIGTGDTFLHLNNMLQRVRETKPGKETRIAPVLHQIAESIRRRALVIILSDLFDDPEAVSLAIAHFRRQMHDVVVFHVLDPAEIDLSFRKGAEFEDVETGEKLVVDPVAMARDYRKVFGEFLDHHRKSCAALNVDYRLARTDQTIETFVRAYLEERRRLSK